MYNKKIDVIIKIFWIVITIITIGNYENRLSNIHTDMGSVYLFLLSKYDYIKNDLTSYVVNTWSKSSIFFLIPKYGYELFGVSPKILDYILYIAQLILMPIYLYEKIKKINQENAMIIALLFYAINPFNWNFAAYFMLNTQPFYTVIACNLLFIYTCELLTGKNKIYIGFISLLFHPVFGVYAFIIYIFIDNKLNLRKILYASILVLVPAIIVLYNKTQFIVQKINDTDHWNAINLHMHSNPFNGYYDMFYSLSMGAIGVIIGYFLLRKDQNLIERKYIYRLLFAVIFLSLIQVIGILIKSPNITLLLGFRAWSVMSGIFLLLIGYQAIFNNLNKVLVKYIVYMPVCGAFQITTFIESFKLFEKNYFRYLFIIIEIIIISLGVNKYLYPGKNVSLMNFTAVAASYILILLIPKISYKKLILYYLIIIVCIKSYKSYQESNSDYLNDLYSAQIWVKENTNKNSIFISPYNWRTISERSTYSSYPMLTELIYTPSTDIFNYNQVLFKLYGINSELRGYTVEEINNVSFYQYNKLVKKDFNYLKNEYNINYIVRSSADGILDYPIVYFNKTLKIYKIN